MWQDAQPDNAKAHAALLPRQGGSPPARTMSSDAAREAAPCPSRIARACLDGRPGLAERARARFARRACPVRAPGCRTCCARSVEYSHTCSRTRPSPGLRRGTAAAAVWRVWRLSRGTPRGLCTSTHASLAARSYILCLHGVLIAWSLIASTLGPSWCASAPAALRGAVSALRLFLFAC